MDGPEWCRSGAGWRCPRKSASLEPIEGIPDHVSRSTTVFKVQNIMSLDEKRRRALEIAIRIRRRKR